MKVIHLVIISSFLGWPIVNISFWGTSQLVKPVNECLVKTINSLEQGNEGYRNDLLYDVSGNLISGTEIDDGDSYPITFTTSGDTSMFSTAYAPDEIDNYKFIYKNGLLMENGYSTNEADGSGYHLQSRYIYDENSHLLYSLNYKMGANGDYSVNDSITYTYNNSKTNIIESVSHVPHRVKTSNGWRDTVSVAFKMKYVYDKNINPIKNSIVFYSNWSSKYLFPIIMSNNNATHIEKIFLSKKQIYDREYTYNDKGYPIKIIEDVIVKGDTSTNTTYFEYFNCN